MRQLVLIPIVAASILTFGCVPVPLARPAQHRVTENAVAPTTRLGRWDGAQFVPVAPGSVEPTRVHVIVHGWAPGWHRNGRAPVAPAWDAELDGRPFDPWMRQLASALGERDPYAAIFIYSWLDDAATTSNPMAQRRAFARTANHGVGLATAVESILGDDFHARGGRVHLIGHSFGARVATIAATSMVQPPRHLTILDAPDAGFVPMFGASVQLSGLLRQLDVGRGPEHTFVDNYISAFGRSYRTDPGLQNVVDVQTTPRNGTFDLSSKHIWAAEFYSQTAETGVGIDWSPLMAGQPPRGCYTRPYDDIALVPVC